MNERPIIGIKAAQQAPKAGRKNIQSDIFEGTPEELYMQYVSYRLLYEFGKLVAIEIDIDRVINVLLDNLIILTGAERSLIQLFDSQDKIAYQMGRNLLKKDMAAAEFQVSRSIIDHVRKNNKPVYLKNALESDEFKASKSVFRLRILSVMCLPVAYQGRVIGVLYTDHRSVKGIFKETSFWLAQMFVDLISGPLYAALNRKNLERSITELQNQLVSREKYHTIIGSSPAILNVLKFIDQAADTTATVIVEGESGTGKELVARALHENSRRRSRSFISINCGALPESLLESELFGYVKGAFTGAIQNKKGWFETADGGTIFFDEISEMSPALQVKLLRVLQTGEFSPVGSTVIKTCNVRVITATNLNLDDLVAQKKFRKDLFYRLNVLNIKIPPLRDRREDIRLLAQHFIRLYGMNHGKENLKLSTVVQNLLVHHDFPGNVRELENAMQRAAVLVQDGEVQVAHLPESFQSKTTGTHEELSGDFKTAKQQVLDDFERKYIENALRRANGTVVHAAQSSGMDPKNFYQKMKKYQIDTLDFKKANDKEK